MNYDFWASISDDITIKESDIHPKQKVSFQNYLLYRKLLTWYVLGPESEQPVTEDKVTRDGRTKTSVLGSYKDLAKQRMQNEVILNRAREAFSDLSFAPDFMAEDSAVVLPWSNAIKVVLSWKLTSPWFSRAESEFDVMDNPLCRESLSGMPHLKGSGLKGLLQQAAEHLIAARPELLSFCFGDANEKEDDGKSGNVKFGSTFFPGVDVDLISPHNRKFGVVEHPVSFEVVPTGTEAYTSFLIFPRDQKVGSSLQALELLLKSFQLLVEELGMSAKRTIGYGMGELTTLKIYTGEAIDLGAAGREEHKIPFPETEPEKPTTKTSGQKPKYADVLIRDGKLCAEGDALNLLVEHECKERGLTKPKQKETVRKNWEKKGKALQAWKDCEQWLAAKDSGQADEELEKAKAYESWLARKEAWQNDPANTVLSGWHYDSFEVALRAIKEAMQ